MKNIKKSLMVAIAATALATVQSSQAMLSAALRNTAKFTPKTSKAFSVKPSNTLLLPRLNLSNKPVSDSKKEFAVPGAQVATPVWKTYANDLWKKLTGKQTSTGNNSELEAAAKKSGEKSNGNSGNSTPNQSSFVAYKIAQAKNGLLAALGLAAGIAYCESEDDQEAQDSAEQNEVMYTCIHTMQGNMPGVPGAVAFADDNTIFSGLWNGYSRKWSKNGKVTKYTSTPQCKPFNENTEEVYYAIPHFPDTGIESHVFSNDKYAYSDSSGFCMQKDGYSKSIPQLFHIYATGNPLIHFRVNNKKTLGITTYSKHRVPFSSEALLYATKQLESKNEYTNKVTTHGMAMMSDIDQDVTGFLTNTQPGEILVIPLSVLSKEDPNRYVIPKAVKLHDAPITAITLSDDGNTLATADTEGVVKIWDVSERRERLVRHTATIKAHDGEIVALALDFNGQKLISHSKDDQIKEWRMEIKPSSTSKYDPKHKPM